VDIKEIRRTNVKTLIAKAKNQSAFAAMVQTTPAYISQILSAKSPGNIGSHFSRRVEKVFELDSGWMDTDHSEVHFVRVPLLNVAEILLPQEDRAPVTEQVITFERVSDDSLAFMLSDDSMDSVSPSGSIVVVDPHLVARHGSIILVSTTNGLFVRELVQGLSGLPMLKPANSRYPMADMTKNMRIVGVVVESIFRKNLLAA
jgi:SOS-response transcriptional repressor LexA